jgi:intracellular sulfur oxidation DsrE/DsrF family protein
MIKVFVFLRGSKPMSGVIALLVTSGFAAAQDAARPPTPKSRHHAATHRHADIERAKPAATGQIQKPSAVAVETPAPAQKKEHHLILQVNTNDPAAMNLTLNNAMNVTQYYQETGEPVKIEVVAFGPGLHMLRDDTSPVKARIEAMARNTPQVSFKACGNTLENMHKAENKDIPIIPQAQLVESGVVHIMELEEQGWAYIKP